MRLGGWTRLGIVISALYGGLVAFVAYVDQPRLDILHRQWFSEAADSIADAIAKTENIRPSEIRSDLLRKSVDENVAWLERVADSPTDAQKLFSDQVKRINEKHKRLIYELPGAQFRHWLKAFVFWAVGTTLLFACGLTVRWIYRGFRGNAV